MTEFDPIKAKKEEIAGLSDVHRVILSRAREAERVLGEAEAEHSSLAKLAAFITEMLDVARAKLRAMEDQAEKT